jgi:hypothetical protein
MNLQGIQLKEIRQSPGKVFQAVVFVVNNGLQRMELRMAKEPENSGKNPDYCF